MAQFMAFCRVVDLNIADFSSLFEKMEKRAMLKIWIFSVKNRRQAERTPYQVRKTWIHSPSAQVCSGVNT